MQCAPSYNPSIASESAFCQQAPERWTQAAWTLGIRLLQGPLRTRNGRAGDRLVSDLVRRGLVESRGAGWLRLTDEGRAQFPRNRCARTALGLELDRTHLRACFPATGPLRGRMACDDRPAAWRSAAAALCRRCDPEPAPATPRRGRVPVQVVRGDQRSNVAPLPADVGAPALEDLLRRAPAHDFERQGGYHWPGLGFTDPWPATRIGY